MSCFGLSLPLAQSARLGIYFQGLIAAIGRIRDNLATTRCSGPAILLIDITECQAVEILNDLEGGLCAYDQKQSGTQASHYKYELGAPKSSCVD